jgi:hypothetical protein
LPMWLGGRSHQRKLSEAIFRWKVSMRDHNRSEHELY